MVQNVYPHDFTGPNQPLSAANVILAGCWISAGMVVNEQDSRRRLPHGRAEDLTGMDQGGVQGAFGNPLDLHDPVLAVQKGSPEDLLLQPLYQWPEMKENLKARTKALMVNQRNAIEAGKEARRCHDGQGLLVIESGPAKLPILGVLEALPRSEVFQETPRPFERLPFAHPRSNQKGQQFQCGESLPACVEEPPGGKMIG